MRRFTNSNDIQNRTSSAFYQSQPLPRYQRTVRGQPQPFPRSRNKSNSEPNILQMIFDNSIEILRQWDDCRQHTSIDTFAYCSMQNKVQKTLHHTLQAMQCLNDQVQLMVSQMKELELGLTRQNLVDARNQPSPTIPTHQRLNTEFSLHSSAEL